MVKPLTWLSALILLIMAAVAAWGSFISSQGSEVVMVIYEVSVSGVYISMPFLLDTISLLFLLAISLISLAVTIFSVSYMANEKFYKRFYMIIFLFIFSMITLIVSPSLISLLVGWDGLGVTSFLLVVYFYSHKSMNAGLLTAMTNRLGDCLILTSIAYVLMSSSPLLFLSPLESGELMVVAPLLVLASTTKSAQIPFSAWLPAAMAAPTPVSSLVHSSTLVTAGVYIMIRFSEMLSNSAPFYLLMMGALTMTMAGVSALYEMDMKKIVALSTLSQLGLMMAALGLKLHNLAFFHLLTHAFFKALLFMSVGNMIHLSAGLQDLRMVSLLPSSAMLSSSLSLIANMSLAGLPFLGGFFTKDLILESAWSSEITPVELGLLSLSAFFTAAYSVRMVCIILMMWQTPTRDSWVNDQNLCSSASTLILWPTAVFVGGLLQWCLFYSPASMVLSSSFKGVVPITLVLGGLMGLGLASKPRKSHSFWVLGNMWALPLSTPSAQPAVLALGGEWLSWADLLWVGLPIYSPSYKKFTSSFMEVSVNPLLSVGLLLSCLLVLLIIYLRILIP